MLLLPDILLPLNVDPLDLPAKAANCCEAFLPSLIATAVCSLELDGFRSGSGTNPARSGGVKCKSGGRCSCANIFAVSGSFRAYLSARD